MEYGISDFGPAFQAKLEPESMLVIFKPIDVMVIIGANGFNPIPESLRVIHMQQVADFMSDHVIDYAEGRQHNHPVVLRDSC